MEGTPLLDVLRGLILEPDAQADFAANPSGYMQRFGYDDVDADQMDEAVGLVADTLPSDVAQAVNDAAQPAAGTDGTEADGDALGVLHRLSALEVDPASLEVPDDVGELDYGGMEGEGGTDEADLDPFGSFDRAEGVDDVADDLDDDSDYDEGRGDASFGDDLDDDTLDDDTFDGGDDTGFGGGLGSELGASAGASARHAVDDLSDGPDPTGGFGEGSEPAGDDAGVAGLFDGADDTFGGDEGTEAFGFDDPDQGDPAFGLDDPDEGGQAFGYDDPDEGGQAFGDEPDDEPDDGEAGGDDVGLF